MGRFVVAFTVALAVAAGFAVLYRPRDELVFSPAKKVCQLTGDWDKQYHKQARNAGFGVTGTDYGYPVLWQSSLYFFFGDTRSIDPDDYRTDHYLAERAKGYDSVALGPAATDV